MSIQPFVQAIGYRNATKGVRAFDSILAYGYPNEVFLERLCSSSLAPDAQLLKEAIDQTWSILADEEREAEKARKEAEREAFRRAQGRYFSLLSLVDIQGTHTICWDLFLSGP
jgi:hypothetical protein